jgi:hypothetical protein
MCDYSLQHVASRPAAAGQRLVTSRFPGSTTRGFSEVGEPAVAICLLPGTEIAFDYEAKAEPNFPLMPKCRIGERVARFRQVALDQPMVHHDALEFANGEIILLTRLAEGQRATVLQLPHGAVRAAEAEPVQNVTTAARRERAW